MRLKFSKTGLIIGTYKEKSFQLWFKEIHIWYWFQLCEQFFVSVFDKSYIMDHHMFFWKIPLLYTACILLIFN